jgi:hypothetical protein
MYRVYLNKYGEKYFILLCYVVYAEIIILHIFNYAVKSVANWPFKDVAQTALFKDPVRTAL